MRVLLIIPSRSDNPRTAFTKFPNEILTTAAVLEQYGHEVEIFDRNVDERLPKNLNQHPQVIGFSVVTGYQITDAIRLSEEYKALFPGIKIVWGGIHPSMMPEQTAIEPYIDYVVIGAGEYTLLELIRYFQGSSIKLEDIKGLAYKKDGIVQVNDPRPFTPNLDELPNPAWHLIDVNKYREVAISAGRGCPFRCSFCSNLAFHKGYMRSFSVSRIVSWMERLEQQHGLRFVFISEENLAFNHERLQELYKLIKQKKLKIKWNCDVSGIPNEEDIILMAKCGCVSVSFFVENGSRRMLEFIRKDISAQQIEKAFWLFIKHRITPTLYFTHGLPTETIDDFQRTQELIKRLDNPPYLLARFVPYPGTTLYDYCVTNGLVIPPKRLADWPLFVDECATGINFSNVPEELTRRTNTEYQRTYATRRIRFTMRHNPAYFLKLIRNPVGFAGDLRALIRNYAFMSGNAASTEKHPNTRKYG